VNTPTGPASPRPLPALNAILDDDIARAAGWSVPDLARACLTGGARFLQVRAKHLASGSFLALCDEVMALAVPCGATVIVNDRADIARLGRASGVHVGQEDLTPSAVRAVVGDTVIVGLSTHTSDQVRSALSEPIDYVAVGPIFATRTKDTGHAAVGLEFVRVAAALAREAAARDHRPPRPIVAIGGMALEQARAVIRAGATSVAVISDLLSGGDPEARVRKYLEALDA
jgi:thiamine-phosphate pyrophosphorylase